ncbi:UDP-N-acetylmuramate:L-alanyl-gamma-D-glutamyl-meso-diaminopimelate ligase [Alteromonas sp. 5E99-2]|uniref:UDP-N-acetylmuramate:L-alanyl-gamma-D-glutamyl- meso-diaminopimelate ligase n=1 Tax=Alteromonas sp. 5E99-2 TaxID=2817683 RepID=UPI001A98FDA8|nr:UDP-N-acetylmuramate:L-alanyl-gamma-D-glutamyl-meso-diaminopimelate ligase [Alteromonas sp. 5E99-2]MBO1255872.1 UDP-N-acetylmuramate:L-alanyl-gamma-D-glutamyl-meso-diaminopimelate ligase [Alteromonas sp. 5E99-2]
MHLHILGICGTFMGGIAALASSLGHKVTGSDSNVYPPMSTQLENQGISLSQLDDLAQFDTNPDLVVIGNALSRGHPAVEYVLNNNIPYNSGPEWLRENLLRDRWVLAVAGTHGKTTTTSMLTWILEYAGLKPGFLIGGVAQNFNQSARLGESPFFIIEADEYDSAFFDKRAKCVHYLPRTLIINNLEFDHADIYANLEAIQTQLHHAVRTVPEHGCVLSFAKDEAVQDTLAKGCWSEQRQIGKEWQVKALKPDFSEFEVSYKNSAPVKLAWSLFGEHNMHNGVMAIAAAHHVGVKPDIAVQGLSEFINVKRRMELRGEVNGVRVYDDFAHHPTAIKTSLSGLKKRNEKGRIIAVIEPRSNTMKMGIHKDALDASWQDADEVWVKVDPSMAWFTPNTDVNASTIVNTRTKTDDIVYEVVRTANADDTIVVMSNGGFDGIHQKLLEAL